MITGDRIRTLGSCLAAISVSLRHYWEDGLPPRERFRKPAPEQLAEFCAVLDAAGVNSAGCGPDALNPSECPRRARPTARRLQLRPIPLAARAHRLTHSGRECAAGHHSSRAIRP